MKSTKFSASVFPASILLVLLADGFLWFKSSWGKLSEGVFIENIGATLTKFASKNPNAWFKDLLTGVAIPNATAVGTMVMYGEFFFATSVLLSVLAIFGGVRDRWALWLLGVGLLGLAVMNLTFWLAAGWTSSSTDSLNVLMFAVEVVGLWLVYRSLMAKS